MTCWAVNRRFNLRAAADGAIMSEPQSNPASRQSSHERASHEIGPSHGERTASHDRANALGPVRFSLRSLLVLVTACACLFATMSTLGAKWSLGLLFFLCLIAGHVLGNSLGVRLRDGAPRDTPGQADRQQPAPEGPIAVGPPARLAQHTRLHRITLIMFVGGALIGGALGGRFSGALYPEAGWPALALGVISSAVLGGFVGFVISSFLSVLRQAWREALHAAETTTPAHVRRDPP